MMCLHMHRIVYVRVNCVDAAKGLLKVIVMYIANVVVSEKWCNIAMLLLQNTNRKLYTA